MASTYSTSLRINLMATGDQSGTWGTTTNINLGTVIEEAIAGVNSISVAGLTAYTLTTVNGAFDQARSAAIIFTGTITGNCTITAPAVSKLYIINNNTSGGYNIIMTTGSGTTVTIPNGLSYWVYTDGTNFYYATNFNANAVVITGGTINGTTIGATTPSTGAFTTLSATGNGTIGTNSSNTLTINSTATTATQTAGDNSTKLATTAYVATAVTNATGSLGTMSSQNANNVNITGGTITGIIAGSPNYTGTPTFTGTSSNLSGVFTNATELVTVSATAATGTINFDVTTQSVLYYTSSAAANFTINFRASSGTSLNTAMSTGQAITVAFMNTNGSTPYYNNAVTIDGTSVTPKWQGGSAPTSGNASSVDIYTYTIIKTASATYTVLASQSQFA